MENGNKATTQPQPQGQGFGKILGTLGQGLGQGLGQLGQLTNINLQPINPLNLFRGHAQTRGSSNANGSISNEPEFIPNFVLPDEAILEKLPPIFNEEKMDVIDYVLSTTLADGAVNSDDPLEKVLEKEMQVKERALDIVSSHLYKHVMSNYGGFVTGMQNIHELGQDLQRAIVVCKNSRSSLARAKEELTQKVLVIIAKYRKLQVYQQILSELDHLRNLKEAKELLRTAIDEGNFPKAIQLTIQCREDLVRAEPYICAKELITNIHECYDLLQEKLDASLGETCRHYSDVNYERVVVAYRLLGQSSNHVSMKLEKILLENLNQDATSILYTHVLLSSENSKKTEALKKLKFRNLKDSLKEPQFFSCLYLILELLCDSMHIHFELSMWHKLFLEKSDMSNSTEEEGRKFMKEVSEGLAKTKAALWEDMQNRVAVMISVPFLNNLPLDEYLKVFDAISRFLETGEEWSQIEAHQLKATLKAISKTYFDNLHKSKMENLAVMLENENWQKCPVAKSFSPLDIKELKPFRYPPSTSLKAEQAVEVLDSPSVNLSMSQQMVVSGPNEAFGMFWSNYGNPFNRDNLAKMHSGGGLFSPLKFSEKNEDSDSDSDEAPQNEEDDILPTTKKTTPPAKSSAAPIKGSASVGAPSVEEGPLLTTTTVNVAHLIGKYVQMLRTLRSTISWEIFIGLSQLFEYYVYFVLLNFADSAALTVEDITNQMANDASISIKFKTVLGKFTKYFPKSVTSPSSTPSSTSANPASGESSSIKPFPIAKLNPGINIYEPQNLYGLSYRVVAVQSILFLETVMNFIKPHVLNFIPKIKEKSVQDFFSYSVDVTSEIHKYLHRHHISKILNWEDIVNNVSNAKFDTKEIGIETSPYCELIVKELKNYHKKFTAVVSRTNWSPKVKDMLWDLTVQYSMEQLVEGYGRSKRCTNEGRALMSLDFKTLQAAIEKNFGRSIPNALFVDNFIKAFYLGEGEFLPWCKDHPEYTLKQHLNILNVGCGNSMKKNTKQELTLTLENWDKSRRKVAAK